MELKNISFGKGIHRSPSVATDNGELSECVNLIPRGGELVNIRPPMELGITAPTDTRLMAIHHVDDTRHYIFYGHQLEEEITTTLNLDPDNGSDGSATTPTTPDPEKEILRIYIYASDTHETTFSVDRQPDAEIKISFVTDYRDVSTFGYRQNGTSYEYSIDPTDYGNKTYWTSVGANETGIEIKKLTYSGNYRVLIMYGAPTAGAKGDTKYPGLTYIDEKDSAHEIMEINESASEINRIEVMGNFLITIGDKGLHYYIWKEGSYVDLGEMPDINLKFSLDSELKTKDYSKSASFQRTKRLNWDEGDESNLGFTKDQLGTALYSRDLYGSADTATLKEAGLVIGKFYIAHGTWIQGGGIKSTKYSGINLTHDSKGHWNWARFLFVEDLVINDYMELQVFDDPVEQDINLYYAIYNDDDVSLKGILGNMEDFLDFYYNEQHRFLYPFFVRYALKLYDGSYLHQSAPILMLPNSSGTPRYHVNSITWSEDQDETGSDKTQGVSGFIAAFVSDLKYQITSCENLDNWEGLVSGIDIAISDPIIRYKADAEWDANVNRFKLSSIISPDSNYTITDDEKKKASDALTDKEEIIIDPPTITDNQYYKLFKNVSNFYVIQTIDFQDIKSTYTSQQTQGPTVINMEDYDLQNLDALDAMYDSPTTFDHMIAGTSFIYNSKFHLANLKIGLNTGLSIPSPLLHQYDSSFKYRLVITAQDRGKTAITDSNWIIGDPEYALYFFTDIEHVTKVLVYSWMKYTDGAQVYRKIELKPVNHGLLTGMYKFNFSGFEWQTCTAEEACTSYSDENNYLEYANTIYASKTNNPLIFPATGMSDVGQEEIEAVSTSAKALSSGTSFGQFPLYCFCTDGVWPLSVNTDGTYGAPNPASREPCNNTSSICQIDGAVVYATEAGLMMIQGQEVQKLSDAMQGYNVSEDSFFSSLQEQSKDHYNLVVNDTNSIVDLLSTSRIICDYAHSLIHIYPDEPARSARYAKHYVYSFATDAWSTVSDDYSEITTSVIGYPCTTIQTYNGKLIQFRSDEDLTTMRNGILLTRPICFDDPTGLKVIADLQAIYTRGSQESVRTQIFASNDRVTWYPLKSLKAHAYKWYRFRVRTTLNDNDSLLGLTCVTEARRTNKLR